MSRATCGAKNRAGGLCGRAPAKGRTRCRLHGGASLVGTDAPGFKHGRHSRYLPVRLLETYEQSIGDPQVVALRDELALVDARLGELLKNVDHEGFREQWIAARHAFDAFHQANLRGDGDAMKAALTELHAALTRGLADHVKWGSVMTLLEQRRKLSETEQRRLERAHNAMSAERAMVLLARVVDIIRLNVHDPKTLSAIALGIKALAVFEPPTLAGTSRR